MEENYIELIDYSIPMAIAGILATVLSLLAGQFGLPAVIVATLVSVFGLVLVIAVVVFILDPLLFRTPTKFRIEWQWLGDKIPQIVED